MLAVRALVARLFDFVSKSNNGLAALNGFLWQNVELPEFAKHRMRLSSEFAAAPTERLASELRKQGVDYFVIDKSNVSKTNSPVVANVLLEDERFELLKL